MGYYKHDMIVVTVSNLDHPEMPDVAAFRRSLPEPWQRLVVGPIEAAANCYQHFVFLPDGSKEDVQESDEGDGYRRRFAALFSFQNEDGSSPFEVYAVRYGGSEPQLSGITNCRDAPVGQSA